MVGERPGSMLGWCREHLALWGISRMVAEGYDFGKAMVDWRRRGPLDFYLCHLDKLLMRLTVAKSPLLDTEVSGQLVGSRGVPFRGNRFEATTCHLVGNRWVPVRGNRFQVETRQLVRSRWLPVRGNRFQAETRRCSCFGSFRKNTSHWYFTKDDGSLHIKLHEVLCNNLLGYTWTKSPPTLTSADHQRTVNTSTGCNQ